jgi:hypothetical protein
MIAIASPSIKRSLRLGLAAAALMAASPGPLLARSPEPASLVFLSPTIPQAAKGVMTVADQRSTDASTEMEAAKALTTRVLAIGSWTAKATPEKRLAIMPAEARDTMRLELAGKFDQWFAKSDGSGAVFLMNVTDPAEAHALLEKLPLGQAEMMTFQLIPVGPLWPLGLLLREPH